ncbi:hypothetical protein H4Q26_017520 [Puccinia striiformis f. sp. tritici PST-130]|nr:hypothetical protein H4Q26_017520 [Puccinia striiformis f. sp. tritici PST-130]
MALIQTLLSEIEPNRKVAISTVWDPLHPTPWSRAGGVWIIGQELARTVGWGVERFSQITETVNNITKRIGSIRNDPTTTADHIDNLPLGSMSRLEKLDLIKHEMKIELNNHGSLLQDWTTTLPGYGVDASLKAFTVATVEDEIEDAVLEVDHDDGEDVAEETIPDVGSDIIAAGAQ